jgi:predicted PurR-regulated permease PerM
MNALARQERRALGFTALAAVALIFWLMRPMGMAILLGALMAFTFQPTYERLARRWPPQAAGLATVIGSTLAVALTFGALVWILIHDGVILGRQVLESFAPGGDARHLVESAASVTSRFGISAEDLEHKARGLLDGAVARGAGIAGAIAAATATLAIAVLFSMLTMYFILRQWPFVSQTAQDTLPLRPEYTNKLFEEFRRVGRTTLVSTVLLALVEGALAAVGYVLFGVPRPLFFGALTTATSPIPGVGTMLVWVPAGVTLIALGHVVRGILVLLWGVVVVTGVPEYVLRPRLVGKDVQMPAVLTFTALFGGVAVFGMKGLILGPLLMAIAMVALRLYADEARSQRAAH